MSTESRIMMNKTELLNDLFSIWEENTPGYKGKFVKDGIIDEEKFLVAPIKILFITKEPNNPAQKPGDFRDWWHEKFNGNFSHRIAEWSYGILNDFLPQYDDICTTILMKQFKALL